MMTCYKLTAPTRKYKIDCPKRAPFPVPIQSHTGRPTGAHNWSCFKGQLVHDHVLVTQAEHIKYIYQMGFFGKGNLSHHQPQYNQHPDKANRDTEGGQTDRLLRVTKRRRYLRHLGWNHLDQVHQGSLAAENFNEKDYLDDIPGIHSKDNLLEDGAKRRNEYEPFHETDQSLPPYQSHDISSAQTSFLEGGRLPSPASETAAAKETCTSEEEAAWDTQSEEQAKAFWSSGDMDWPTSKATASWDTPADEDWPMDEKAEESWEASDWSMATGDKDFWTPEERHEDQSASEATGETKGDPGLPAETTRAAVDPQREGSGAREVTQSQDTNIDVEEAPRPDVVTEEQYMETGDVTTEKADVTTEKADVTTEKADVTTEKADVTTEKADVTTEKADLTTEEAGDDVIPEDTEVCFDPRSLVDDPGGDILVIPDSDESGDEVTMATNQKLKWKDVQKRDPVKLQECLQLSLEEAFFLSYGLGCLIVYDENQKPLNLIQMWQRFMSLEAKFLGRYVVYHNLRSKGWVPKLGIVYGADFIVYKAGPPFYHSSYAVLVRMATEKDLRDDLQVNYRPLTWNFIGGMNRITEQVTKEVMLCYVIKPTDITEQQLASPACLSRFKVQEIILKRWVSKEERESKAAGDTHYDIP